MGRPRKTGLDYFELDCQLDEKVKLIQAEFDLKGFAIFIKLLQKIYGGNGYYCEWSSDSLLLFMSENNISPDNKSLMQEIVMACIRRGIFSKEKYAQYKVLTSRGIQKRYLNATIKRENVEVKKEYLLLSDAEIPNSVVINSVSSGINLVSDGRNTQSKVEKSKEEYYINAPECAGGKTASSKASKTEPKKAKESPVYFSDEILNKTFLDFLDMRKKIRHPATQRAIEMLIKKINNLATPTNGLRMDKNLAIAIIEQSILNSWQDLYPLRGTMKVSTTQSQKRSETKFHNFEQRDTDYDAILRQLNTSYN